MKNNLKILLLANLIIFSYCFNRKTLFSDNGGGDVIFLDRHRVYCNAGEILTGFNLESDGDYINYQFTCVTNEFVNPGTYDDATDWTKAADDVFASQISADRLTAHQPACRNDYGLRGFAVQSQFGFPIWNIRIIYTCVQLKVVSTSSNFSGWVDSGDGQNYTLNKLWVQMGINQALTGFRLYCDFYSRFLRRDGRYFRYFYSWANLRDVNSEADTYNTSVKNGSAYVPPFTRILQFLLGKN